uniref:NFACT-R_1 domain-containing protein n=1 Tax=Globodera pallida TaxID=36090 RepID=A0A183C2H0_GLOPA
MIVVFGSCDGPDQYEFHTDDTGSLKFNFWKQIHQSNLIKEACKNIKSKKDVTIFVVKGGKYGKRRRILCQFQNYAEMLKKMEETNGQIYHAHKIEFEKLKKTKTISWATPLEEVLLFSKDPAEDALSEEDDLSDEHSGNKGFDDDILEKLLATSDDE